MQGLIYLFLSFFLFFSSVLFVIFLLRAAFCPFLLRTLYILHIFFHICCAYIKYLSVIYIKVLTTRYLAAGVWFLYSCYTVYSVAFVYILYIFCLLIYYLYFSYRFDGFCFMLFSYRVDLIPPPFRSHLTFHTYSLAWFPSPPGCPLWRFYFVLASPNLYVRAYM